MSNKKNIIKKDIVDHLYSSIGFPKKELNSIISDIFNEISTSLIKKDNVKVKYFGTFSVKFKNKRIVYNPKTKEENEIAARNVVSFLPSKSLRKFLKE